MSSNRPMAGRGMNQRVGSYPAPIPMGLQLTNRVLQRLQELGAGKQGRVVDVLDWVQYDTLRFAAANATTTNVFRMFQVPSGQTTTVANLASETYAKSEVDTNQEAAGILPAGQELWVNSIQLFFNIPGQTDTTYPTSGPATELPSSTAAAALVSGVNLMKAVMTQCTIQFKVGEKRYENGPAFLFPCAFGISGFAGGVGAATGQESVANNGFGLPRILYEPRQIPELVNFSIDLKFVQALTITRQFTLTALLHGILLRPVQ